MIQLAKEHHVPENFVFEAYRLSVVRDREEYSAEYDELFGKYYIINHANCLDEILIEIRYLVSHTIRASSLVENTNHKIRPYIEMKKVLSPGFCCLLQLYLISKPYRRKQEKDTNGTAYRRKSCSIPGTARYSINLTNSK